MTLAQAVWASERLLALAFVQQSAEHLALPHGSRMLFAVRLLLAVALAAGLGPAWPVEAALLGTSLWLLHRFDGPFNGGSDRMGLLLLCGLLAHHLLPARWSALPIGYVAVQLVLSYFLAGVVKIANPEWRNGRALADVFAFSAYPTSESLRAWAARPRVLAAMAWGVMAFELAFPLAIANAHVLWAALAVALAFHVGNAWAFGLNRFVPVWLAAYSTLLWLQARLAGHAGPR